MGGETILVVDDEPAILGLVGKILQRGGYDVLLAQRPSEAYMLALEHGSKISLLLTDVVMRGMRGPMLAQALITMFPHLKVLLMSGQVHQEAISVEGQKWPFIEKPFYNGNLLEKVRQALDHDGG